MSESRPRVENAPGLVWRRFKSCWTARWQARHDLVKAGYAPSSVRLWSGTEPNEIEQQFISDICNRLQDEMLVWSRGGIPEVSTFDGTIAGLIACYRTDPDSNYRRIRYKSRQSYDYLFSVIQRDHGDVPLAEINGRALRHWHGEWSTHGISMAHGLVGMMRTLATFGSTLLDDEDCARIKGLLHDLKFKMGQPRTERLTADQANLIRAKAHEMGRPSIALAQAFQFECMLRQKDVIGEWVPNTEPGLSDVTDGQLKWLRGLRWSEIDGNLILRHTTSKRQKDIEVNLNDAPMVIAELQHVPPERRVGPVILREVDGIPWVNTEFRRWWRIIAQACGIPKAVKNMDSRAGAISEATDAGAELEHIRHASTHGDIGMVQRYSRGSQEKAAGVLRKRVAHRNKAGTSGA